jgi:transcriptional regulator with XRE-family HTH domain
VREDELYKSFGQAVAISRRGRMTQIELARSVGMSRASVANIERGEQRVYLHHIIAIAESLDVAVSDLLPASLQYEPYAPAKVSVSGDKVNRTQARAIKELVSALTQSVRKVA